MPLHPFVGTLGTKRAAHLLRRATFGARIEDINQFAGLTAQQAVNLLFQDGLESPEPPLDPLTNETWVINGPTDANSEENELQEFFRGWAIGQIVSPPVVPAQRLPWSIREKIAFFLHAHFTGMVSKINNSRQLYFQNALFRLFSFDRFGDEVINFKSLTKKICVDNAMLNFLDGRLNLKGSVNENFARELFELYSIGRGLEGNFPSSGVPGDYTFFTEHDIQMASKVLSGFNTDNTFSNIDPDTDLPRGVIRGGPVAIAHDNSVKEFSHRFGNHIIAPDPDLLENGEPTEESVLDEIDRFIDMIYDQEETARHICRKIYRYFVYHRITPQMDDTIIASMADTFQSSGFKLQVVIEDLLRSNHFYDAGAGLEDDNFGALIKSPLDLAASTLQFFEAGPPNLYTQVEDFYEWSDTIIRRMRRQGLDFYEPVEVAGYAAYHQFPIYNRSWISTNYLTNRYDFIRGILNSEMMMGDNPLVINPLEFTQQHIPNAIAENARELIMMYVGLLLPMSENLTFDPDNPGNAEITPARLNYFLQAFLFDPQIDADPEAAWTFRWNNPVDPEVSGRQLQNLLNALMQSPEYQLA